MGRLKKVKELSHLWLTQSISQIFHKECIGELSIDTWEKLEGDRMLHIYRTIDFQIREELNI